MANYKSKYTGEEIDIILDGAKNLKIPEIIDNLDSTSKDSALSANMGRELKESIPTRVDGLKRFTYYGYETISPSDESLFKFELNSDGTGYYVSGNWNKEDTTIAYITIPYEYNGLAVVTIQSNGFEGYAHLKSVRIPNTVNLLGNYAFKDCSSLTNVYMPEIDNFVGVGRGVFFGCAALQEIPFKSKIHFYPCESLFEGCTSLTEVKIPEGSYWSGSGSRMFANCTSLNKVTWTYGSFYSEIFSGCSSLKEVYIDVGISSIRVHPNAFSGCTSLTDVYYSGSKERWNENYLFEGNECLTSAIIHCNWTPAMKNNIEDLKRIAYYGDANIVPSDNSLFNFQLYDTGDGYYLGAAWDKSDTTIEEIVIPYEYNGLPVRGIVAGGFRNYTSLTKVIMPKTIEVFGLVAFEGCTSLADITFPNKLVAVYGSTFKGCNLPCDVILPELENWIGTSMFSNTNIKSVVIPETFRGLSGGDFENCASLEKVTILSRLEGGIGYDVFNGCTNLTDVYFAGTEEEWNTLIIERFEPTGNEPLLNATIHYNWTAAMKGEVNEALNEIISPDNIDGGKAVNKAWFAIDAARADFAYKAEIDLNGNVIHKTYATKEEVETVESIAKGANRAVAFSSYDEMCRMLIDDTINESRLDYNIGQSIYIVRLNVPDLWVKEYYPDDAVFPPDDEYMDTDIGDYDFESYIYDNITSGNKTVAIGSYVLAPLETQKVDLTEYETKAEASENHIYLDNKINDLQDTLDRIVYSDGVVSHAVSAGCDGDGNSITETYATKEEVGDIDTVLDNIIAIQNTLIGGESA